MIVSRAAIPARARRALRRLWRSVSPAQGQYRADSLAGAQWLERTPQPQPAPILLSPPRVAARRLSVRERVLIQYDAAERAMTERINQAMWLSQLAWVQSYG